MRSDAEAEVRTPGQRTPRGEIERRTRLGPAVVDVIEDPDFLAELRDSTDRGLADRGAASTKGDAREFTVKVTRHARPNKSEASEVDFVGVHAVSDSEAAERALQATSLRIISFPVECHEVGGGESRALELPAGPIRRAPWKPIPPDQWDMEPGFDSSEYLQRLPTYPGRPTADKKDAEGCDALGRSRTTGSDS